MKSTTVVSLTKIAQMLTSRIGRKPLLLTLAATLACLQTAMAASPRSAKAALLESSRLYTKNLRRRLPENGIPSGLDDDAERGQAEFVGDTRLSDVDNGATEPATALEKQQALFQRQIDDLDAQIEEQQSIIDSEKGDEDQTAHDTRVNEAKQRKRELMQQKTAYEKMKKNITPDTKYEKFGKIAGASFLMGAGITGAVLGTRGGLHDIKYGFEDGNISNTFDGEVHVENLEADMSGSMDGAHLAIGLLGLGVFLIGLYWILTILFANHKWQGRTVGALGTVSSVLCGIGMLVLKAHPENAMENYGEVLLFKSGSDVSMLFSSGMIVMIVTIVAAIGFGIWNCVQKRKAAAAGNVV